MDLEVEAEIISDLYLHALGPDFQLVSRLYNILEEVKLQIEQ